MSDKNIAIFAALSAPFENDEIRTRSQSGREFQYITARTAMNRLDEVLGPSNWWDDYIPLGAEADAFICRLTIRFPDGTTLTKTDAGGCSKTNDPSDSEKSGISDAFKRAAVKFGVGRYLYGDGVAPSIRQELIDQRRRNREAAPAREPGGDDDIIIERPEPQRPQSNGHHNGGGYQQRPHNNGGSYGGKPKSGKALFAWAKEQGEKNGVNLIEVINDFGQRNDFGAKMVTWSDEQVDLGHNEALAFLQHNGHTSEARR